MIRFLTKYGERSSWRILCGDEGNSTRRHTFGGNPQFVANVKKKERGQITPWSPTPVQFKKAKTQANSPSPDLTLPLTYTSGLYRDLSYITDRTTSPESAVKINKNQKEV